FEPAHLVLAAFLAQEGARDDPDDLATGFERAAGERSHQADVATPVDHRPASLRDATADFGGKRPVDGRPTVARAAEHADGEALRIAHVSCARGSRDSRASTASRAPMRPSRTATTASVMGRSTPWRRPRLWAARA